MCVSICATHLQHRMPQTVDIGVAVAKLDRNLRKDLFELIRRADAALYHAKEEGRNRVYVQVDMESS